MKFKFRIPRILARTEPGSPFLNTEKASNAIPFTTMPPLPPGLVRPGGAGGVSVTGESAKKLPDKPAMRAEIIDRMANLFWKSRRET